MTRLLLCLLLCLSPCLDCGRKRIPAETPEQIATYGRLAVLDFNQKNSRCQKLIKQYNAKLQQLNRLASVLDLHENTLEQQRELLRQALGLIRELRQLYEGSADNLEQIEETLEAML